MALRTTMRRLQEAAKTKELYYLIYWGESNEVSVHKASEIKEPTTAELDVGVSCMVIFKKKLYEGKIACMGTKSEVLSKESDFIAETFTPFVESTKSLEVVNEVESSADVNKANNSEVTNTAQESEVEVVNGDTTKVASKRKAQSGNDKPRKRKRKLINVNKAESNDMEKKGKGKKAVANKGKGKHTEKKNKKGKILTHACGYEIEATDESDAEIIETIDEVDNPDDFCYDNFDNYPTEGYHSDPPSPKHSISDTASVSDTVSVSDTPSLKGVQYTGALSERMTLLEEQNKLILKQLYFLGNMNPFMTPPSMPQHNWYPVPQPWLNAGDMYTPSTPLQNHTSFMPLPNSTPAQATREPLTTLQTSTPNSDGDATTATVTPSPTSSTSAIISNSSVAATEAKENSAIISKDTVKTTAAKENKGPPPIPHGELISPQSVVQKYPKLMKLSKLSRLSVRLAEESYFGQKVMASCTVKGVGELPALPQTELNKLKNLLQTMALPRFVSSRVEFENLWKSCVESINQACKTIRKKIKEKKLILT